MSIVCWIWRMLSVGRSWKHCRVKQPVPMRGMGGEEGGNAEEEEEEYEEGEQRTSSYTLGYRWNGAKDMQGCGRWEEEVEIIPEEMWRTIVLLEKKAEWWEEQAEIPQFKGAHAEGASAYAYEQSDVCRLLKVSFEKRWERYKDGLFVQKVRKGRKGHWKRREGFAIGGEAAQEELRGPSQFSVEAEGESEDDDGWEDEKGGTGRKGDEGQEEEEEEEEEEEGRMTMT
ncbi:hypothetical protein BT96DRAFT_932325 [Gymnopus androsaceus JB14]|uniref:Uncharacterized protein n=1 Tax=Gymnopus androsaceus JB14 TaxID=1447944 RepID=A0A6A4IH58_9AGAR|nr:hypothetical protein BT96DRAFT_932325 [Gymnopus androsaceus JB14]